MDVFCFFFSTTLSLLTQHVDIGKVDSPVFLFFVLWITLLMDLGHGLKSHSESGSLSSQGCMCVCVCVRARTFAFLLCSAISSVGNFNMLLQRYDTVHCTSVTVHTLACPFFSLLVVSILLIGSTINQRLQNTQTLSAVFDCLSAGLHWAYLVDIVKLLYPECCGR